MNFEVTMSKESEPISYLMLFCALLVAKRNRTVLDEVMMLAPLSGNARLLAGELQKQQSLAM